MKNIQRSLTMAIVVIGVLLYLAFVLHVTSLGEALSGGWSLYVSIPLTLIGLGALVYAVYLIFVLVMAKLILHAKDIR